MPWRLWPSGWANSAAVTTLPELPPFQGGAAGLLSYDLGRSFESVPPPAVDEFHVPALAMGFYDVVVAFDHVAGRAWIISQGLPEIEPSRRRRRAAERLAQLRGWIERQQRSAPALQWGGVRQCSEPPGSDTLRPSIRSPASPG